MQRPNEFQKDALEAAVRIGLLFVLVIWCFGIIKPFVMPIIWAAILAVALHPIYQMIKNKVHKPGTSATILVIICLAIIVLPGWNLISASVDSALTVNEQLEAGTLEIPAPEASVQNWPLVGEKVYSHWSLAAADIESYLGRHGKELAAFGKSALGVAGGAIGTLLMFCFSIIISGVLLANGPACVEGCKRFARSCIGAKGPEMISLSGNTIQSVAKGVLGVAVIQTTLVAIGFFAAGIPAAALLTVVVLIFAIAQLPPILVGIPAIAYVFKTDTTTVAVIFSVWTLIASGSDAFLKPLLLGRGVDVPMLVILLGALGGMMMSGIVGLFVGAVVLAVGYQLLVVWLELHNPAPTADQESS